MKGSRSLEQLVERQVKLWIEEQKRSRVPAHKPCVMISRLPYAGGATIGRRVAEQLGYGFFGREIVDLIEHAEGVQESLLSGLDERLRNAIDRFVTDAFRTRAFTESDYLEDVVRVVTTLGERGMAVIVGRGAPFILPAEKGLRVLMVAPKDVRSERLAKAEGFEREQAGREIERLDRERNEFARRQFGVDQRDPELYDLILNTQHWSVDAAARLIVEALRCRFPGA